VTTITTLKKLRFFTLLRNFSRFSVFFTFWVEKCSYTFFFNYQLLFYKNGNKKNRTLKCNQFSTFIMSPLNGVITTSGTVFTEDFELCLIHLYHKVDMTLNLLVGFVDPDTPVLKSLVDVLAAAFDMRATLKDGGDGAIERIWMSARDAQVAAVCSLETKVAESHAKDVLKVADALVELFLLPDLAAERSSELVNVLDSAALVKRTFTRVGGPHAWTNMM